jgi:RNA polymerase sigma-70 factor (ECF subfamily)
MTATSVASSAEVDLIERLRRGDESAFRDLIEAYGSSLLRLAMTYVGSRAIAEEVVQETWIGVLRGIDRFEGRSSLKTWVFTILANTAKTRGRREARSVPLSALTSADDDEAAVDPSRFFPADSRVFGGGWAVPPESWDELPEHALLSHETRTLLSEAIERLPATQRQVVTLRDVEGWDATGVCDLLGLTEANQRVLLHRARSKLRAALEEHLASG